MQDRAEQARLQQERAEQDKVLARKGRTAGAVIAGAMLLWIGAQWLGPVIGLPGRFALLFDFAALAALFWALVVTFQIWRSRNGTGQSDRG